MICGLLVVWTGAGAEGEHDDALQEPQEHAAEEERADEGPTQTPLQVSGLGLSKQASQGPFRSPRREAGGF